MPHRVSKGEHSLGGLLGLVRLAINALLVKGGLVCKDELETCPARLGRGKHALGGWLGQVRLGFVSLKCPFG